MESVASLLLKIDATQADQTLDRTGKKLVDLGKAGDGATKSTTGLGAAARGTDGVLRGKIKTVSDLTRETLQLDKGAATAGAGLSRLGIAAGLAAAAVVGVGAAFVQARKALTFADEIGDAAAKLAISTKRLQEYRFAIHSLGGDYKDADQAITGFAKSLGEAQSGFSKRATKPFEALGLDAKNLGDTDAALRTVIDRIANLKSSAEQAAIAEKLGISALLPAARAGVPALDDLAAAANRLGFVMDDALIQKAGAANDTLEDLDQVIKVNLNSSLADLAPILVQITTLMAGVASGVAWAAEKFSSLNKFATDSRLGTFLTAVATNNPLLAASAIYGRPMGAAAKPGTTGAPAANTRTGALKNFVDEDAAEEAAKKAEQAAKRGASEAKQRADAARRLIEQQTQSTDRYIESLREETAEIGKNSVERKELESLRQMALAQTPAEIAAIEDATAAWRRQHDALELRNNEQKLANDLAAIQDRNATPAQRKAQQQFEDSRIVQQALNAGLLSPQAAEDELARINNQFEKFNGIVETTTDKLDQYKDTLRNLKGPAEMARDSAERLAMAFDDVSFGVDDAYNGIANKDWMAASRGIISAYKAISAAYKEAGLAGGIGAAAGAAAPYVGGTGGSVLSGIATGASIGTSIPVIGTAIGAVVGGVAGLLGGLFGGNSAKKKAEAEAKQKEQERQEQIADQKRELYTKKLSLEGKYLDAATASREAFFKGIDASNIALAQETYNLERRAAFLATFGTAEEQLADMRSKLAPELESLGLSIDLTRERFKELVNGGGEAAAGLLDLLEPFDAYTKAVAEQAAVMEDAAKALADTLAQGAIDFYVSGQLAADEAARQDFLERITSMKESTGGMSSADARAKLSEQAAAWEELSAKLDMAAASAVRAGDWVGALSAATSSFYNDPANANFVRDQANFSDGSGFNAAGFNAMNVKVQARAAEQLLGTFSAMSIKIPNVVQAMEGLLDTIERANSPEFGGAGSAAGPIQASGLYAAWRKLAFVSSTTDSFGRAGTGFGLDVNDGNSSLTRDEQLRRIAEARDELAREAQAQVRDVFGQIAKGVAELDAAAREAGDPIAKLTDAIGRMNSISQLLTDGLTASSAGFQASGMGQNAFLVSEAASIAAAVLTTQEAKAAAQALGVTRDTALLVEGIRAWDVQSFENSFMRLNNALNTGAITQVEYTKLYNYGLDVFEGLTDAAGGARSALRELADNLRLDETLSALSLPQRLAEAQRQFGANMTDSTARMLLGLQKDTATSQADYNRSFYGTIGRLEAPQTPTMRLDTSALEAKVEGLQKEIASMRAESLATQTAALVELKDINNGITDIAEGDATLTTVNG